MPKKIMRIGIGGPRGSAKTAIVDANTPRVLDLGDVETDLLFDRHVHARAPA